MAVDTREKRASGAFVLMPWRAALPIPDGAISQADRVQTGRMYAGALPVASVTVDHLEIGFETHLRSLSAVTAIVGSSPSRIFPQQAPQVFESWQLQVPYVVFGTTTTERAPTLAGTNPLSRKRLQVNSYAKTYLVAKSLSDAIRLGTDTFKGTMGNVTVLSTTLTNENDVIEQSVGLDERRRHMVSTSYEIWHVEQDPGLSKVTSGVGSADTIEEGIFDVLRLNSRVNAIVNGRIYPEGSVDPNKTPGPYIVYDKPGGDRVQALTQGATGVLESRITLSLWSPTYKQTHDLAEMCRRALDGYTGLMGAVNVLICRLEDETDEVAGAGGVDARLAYSMTQEYEIIHFETAPSL